MGPTRGDPELFKERSLTSLGICSNLNIPQRNDIYYLDFVIFQVEDQLFKVPKYHFARHSEIFESMFSLPQLAGGDPEGSTDSAPLKLEGVDKGDFQTLLEVMYPLETTEGFWDYMSKSQWISVLKLATMWTFKEIRSLAIQKLSKETMGPIELVLLAKQFNVPQWLRSGYQALAGRSEMLSIEEAGQLSYLTAILLFQVREQVRADNWAGGRRSSSYRYPEISIADTSTVIERVFERELRQMEREYNQYLPRQVDSGGVYQLAVRAREPRT